jgi:ATP-dependent helicase IRC3
MSKVIFEPRPYQQEALAAIESGLTRNITRPLVSLPTGCGKTVVFSQLIAKRAKEGRSLIIAHREELLNQAKEKIAIVSPNLSTGIVKAESNQVDKDVLIASIQTLARANRISQLPNNINTIIIDEAHHSPSDSYKLVLEHLGVFRDDNPPLTLGVTATPERLDKKALSNIFQEIVYQKNILEMMIAGYLCDLRAIQIKLDIDFNKLKTSMGDYAEIELSQAMLEAKAPSLIAEKVSKFASDRKTLIFTPNVELAYQIADACQELGLAAKAIDGSLDSQTRKGILEQFDNGSVSILINCNILTEGFDAPNVSCVVMARPTKSKSLYMQCVGRGTRLHPDKRNCLIIDLVGATTSFDLMTVGKAFNLPEQKLSQLSILEYLQEEQEVEREQRSATARLLAENKFLQTRVVDIFNRSVFNWLKPTKHRYVLQTGQGMVIVERVDLSDRWTVYVSDRANKEVLAQDLPLTYATSIAEDHVRQQNLDRFLAKDASWRNRPISQKQKETLEKLKIPIKPTLTQGEASDLIACFWAKRTA